MHILILGGGFTGCIAAKKIAKRLPDATVTVVSPSPYFLFMPRLADMLDQPHLAERQVRANLFILAKKFGYQFQLGEALHVDRKEKKVTLTDSTTLSYDVLVVTIGSHQNYYGIPGAEEYCAKYRSYEQMSSLREKINGLSAGERIVVIGGGATGTEFASSVKHFVHDKDVEVCLVNASDTLLPRSSKKLRTAAMRRLEKQGVKLMAGAAVEEITKDAVMLKGGKRLESAITIWAGGVAPNQLRFSSEIDHDSRGYLLVNECLQITDDIYGGGDCVNMRDEQMYVPNTAQHARQMGIAIAKNIIAQAEQQPLKRFTPHDLGILLRLANTCIWQAGPICISSPLVLLGREIAYRQRMYEVSGSGTRL